MRYLLDILLPGLGHLAARRVGSGLALVVLWATGTAASVVTASFWLEVGLAALAGFHLLLATSCCVHLARLRRKGMLARPPRILPSLGLLFLGPLLVAALLFALSTFLVRPIAVRSGSMEPGIWTGDTVVVQLFWPTIGHVTLGDVVIVAHPGRRGRLLLKRVIGLAGDLIEVRSGEIFRNDRPLAQCSLRRIRDPESRQDVVERLEVLHHRPYLVWDQPAKVARNVKVRVPEGHVFVLGDNRDRSGDSRSFGTVPISSLRGRVLVSLAPPRSGVDQAPVSARRAAFAKCSARGSHGERASDGASLRSKTRPSSIR